MLAKGTKAPEFELADQDGRKHTLKALLKDGPLILYFYPADFTPGCTKEACSFRDSHAVFAEAGAAVLGVSADSAESHRAFAAKHRLPYRLLTDAQGATKRAFGVRKTLGLIEGRVTFVIGQDGLVRKAFSSQLQATRHVEEALEALKA